MISQKAKFIDVPAAWLGERNEFEIFWCLLLFVIKLKVVMNIFFIIYPC